MRPRQRCTSNSVTFEDKTAQHIGSYRPTTLGVVEFQLAAAFLVIFIFDMDRKLNVVELSTLERFSTVERVATRRMARSKVVGQMVRTDDRFMFRQAQGNLLRASTVSTVAKVDLSSNSLCSLAHSSAMFFFFNRFRVQLP